MLVRGRGVWRPARLNVAGPPPADPGTREIAPGLRLGAAWTGGRLEVRLRQDQAPRPAPTGIAAIETHAAESTDVCLVTGPWYLTGMYFKNRSRYDGVRLTAKPVFSPRRIHGRRERKFYVNSGITHGFHYGWGSWRDRLSFAYLKEKVAKRFGRKPARQYRTTGRGSSLIPTMASTMANASISCPQVSVRP